jgi:hypothetical protein
MGLDRDFVALAASDYVSTFPGDGVKCDVGAHPRDEGFNVWRRSTMEREHWAQSRTATVNRGEDFMFGEEEPGEMRRESRSSEGAGMGARRSWWATRGLM